MAKFINELNRFQPLPDAVVESDMSNEACRLYWLMAIKPDGWEYYHKPLMKQMNISSERTFRKYLNELVDNGWVEALGQTRLADGSWSACGYILHSQPDVQKMHNGGQSLPHGKICRTVKNAQQSKYTPIEDNTHSDNIHTHTLCACEETGEMEWVSKWKEKYPNTAELSGWTAANFEAMRKRCNGDWAKVHLVFAQMNNKPALMKERTDLYVTFLSFLENNKIKPINENK